MSALLLSWSCTGTTKEKKEAGAQNVTSISAADSALFHFWDQFDMQDKALVKNPEKEAYRPIYTLVRQNNVGHTATDFSFELPNGQKQKLSETDAKFMLLMFYDSNCSHCKETIHHLRDNPQLVQLFTQLQIQELAIDPWGDRNKWKQYQSELSYQWINRLDTDRQILSANLYNLRASPTIYLLDENKKVLLKDTYLEPVIQYFVNAKK